VTELALDHIEGNALSRHLNRVRVAKLMWCKATTNASARCHPSKALAHRNI
jgi:hypothetical protein